MTQEEFDKQFISTKEIAIYVGVTVAAVWYAERRGQLPRSFTIKHSNARLWLRNEVMPKIEAWKSTKERVTQDEVS